MFFSWDIQFLDPHFARVLWVWVCSFVCLSYVGPFFITFFPRLGYYCFLIFCLKLSDHKYSKLTKWNFFEKILAWPKMGQKAQNGPICQFIHYYSIFLRIFSLVFFIFCIELRDHWYSKLMEPSFLGKLLLAQKQAKKAHNGPTCPFVCYYNIFLRIGSLVFFCENGPKMPKMIWFVCSSIMVAFFLRIGSLDLSLFSDILYELVGP